MIDFGWTILECSLCTCLVSDQLVLVFIVLGLGRGAVEGGEVGHVTVIADVGAGNAADAADLEKRGAAQETGAAGRGMWSHIFLV